MRITELQGQPVVNRATARTLGTIVDVFVDATAARIVALEVAPPGCAGGVRIPRRWITRVGRDAVMVGRRSGAESVDVDSVTDDCLSYRSLVGLEAFDESGHRMGNLRDAGVDLERLSITSFNLVRSGWRGWFNIRCEIRPDEVSSCSRELIVIRGRRVASLGRSGLDPGADFRRERVARNLG